MGYYTKKIKVIAGGLMCFPAHPETLEALSCSCYDAYAYADPDTDPIETISVAEWERRRDEKRRSIEPQ